MAVPVGAVALIVAISVAARWRPHLTDALLGPLVGIVLGGCPIGIVLVLMTAAPWRSPLVVAILGGTLLALLVPLLLAVWLTFYLPLRRLDPVVVGFTIGDVPDAHVDIVMPWLRAGAEDLTVMRSRPKAKSTFYAMTTPKGANLYLIFVSKRWSPFVVTRFGDATLVTTDQALLQLDGREIRQIMSGADPASLLSRHRDAVEHMHATYGIRPEVSSGEHTLDDVIDRIRLIGRRRPWRFVTTTFRSPFHLGPLPTRVSGRWQLPRLMSAMPPTARPLSDRTYWFGKQISSRRSTETPT